MAEKVKTNYWKYLAYFVFWPFSLSWFVWKSKRLNSLAKVGLLSIFWVPFVGAVVISNANSSNSQPSKPSVQENRVVNQSLADERKAFDSSLGNNWEAASTSKAISQSFESAYQDVTFESYVDLKSSQKAEEEFLSGGDLKEYRTKVNQAILGIVVIESWWRLRSEATQRELLRQWTTTISDMYPESFVTVSVGNGRTEYAKTSKTTKNSETKTELN